MWLESTTAPATVSDDEFLLFHSVFIQGKEKTRMIHKSGDLPKLTLEINFRREGLLEFGIFYFE